MLARLHQHSHASTVLGSSLRLDFLHSLHMVLGREGNGQSRVEKTSVDLIHMERLGGFPAHNDVIGI